MLEMKNSVNQITKQKPTNRLDTTEEIILGIDTELSKYYIQRAMKKKIKNMYYHNFQKLLNMIKRPNLRIHRVKEGSEIQTNVMENILSQIVAEKSPNLSNGVDIQVQEALRMSNKHYQEKK
jgi:hypothetical protein